MLDLDPKELLPGRLAQSQHQTEKSIIDNLDVDSCLAILASVAERISIIPNGTQKSNLRFLRSVIWIEFLRKNISMLDIGEYL